MFHVPLFHSVVEQSERIPRRPSVRRSQHLSGVKFSLLACFCILDPLNSLVPSPFKSDDANCTARNLAIDPVFIPQSSDEREKGLNDLAVSLRGETSLTRGIIPLSKDHAAVFM